MTQSVKRGTTSSVQEETLTGAMLVCSLVGRAFYKYPDKEWLESLIAENVFAEAPFAADHPDVVRGAELLSAWSAAHRNGLSDDEFEAISFDYNHLFVGPAHVLAPPWESVHFSADRLIFQKETLHVRDWYARYGLALVYLGHEPDDHIGLELEFLAQLNRLAIEAIHAGDSAGASHLLGAQRDFLSEHPMRWAPKWCQSVITQARTDFYRGIAMITFGALDELAATLATI